jgi:HAD superfamily hydrolase (TIGR01484 family)
MIKRTKKIILDDKLKQKLKKIKFIILDIDGVTVPRGTRIKQISNNLRMRVRKVPRSEIKKIKKLHKRGYILGINSGRGLYLLQDMFRPVLDNIIITYENGSATWYKGKVYQHVNSFEKLNKLRAELEKIHSKDIKGFEPKEFIITIHCKKRIKKIEKIVDKYKGIYWIWNDEAYDIGLKNQQTKAKGLEKVMKILKLKKSQVLFVGDNYNDVSLTNKVGLVVSADKSRLKGDIYVDMHKKKFPAEQVMDIFLNELK